MNPTEFTALFPFGGLGAGARGFISALARLGPDSARFRNLGGIDLDAAACEDFELLSGAPSLCANLSILTPAELIAWLTKVHGAEVANRRPDCVFTSPPCKGFSRLLGNKKALERKYQQLNELVFQGLFLMCETWTSPPPVIILENVPGIVSRGKVILDKAEKLLRNYDYVSHRATHDCGEIGGLAQHRKRFLLIARRPDDVPAYIYQPPKKRVRACGEVLQDLPIPGGDDGGELHALPKLSWLNWVRLALIPAGGDWRDLPGAGTAATNQRANRRPNQYKVRDWAAPVGAVTGDTDIQEGAPSVADPRLGEAVGFKGMGASAEKFAGSPGLMGVLDWREPAKAVTGSAAVSSSNGTAAVADPRIGLDCNPNAHRNKYAVQAWDEPAKTVIGATRPGSGGPSVADPRVPELLSPLGPGQARREVFPKYDVRGWSEPARTVAGSGTNGGFGVADPRVPGLKNADRSQGGALGVLDWNKPAKSVTGNVAVSGSNTPGSVADPRPFDGGRMGVVPWDQPSKTICGESYPSNGSANVADPRVGLDHSPRRGSYEITPWTKPAKTVRGLHDARKSAAAVADPRVADVLSAVPLKCAPRAGAYGVMSWEEAAATITGSAAVDNGKVAVADPRKPPKELKIIISADGTWHRPLTTLELAALQSLPTVINGRPLQLAGRKVAAWRERIGNAVPVHAGEAIATTILKALLAASLGTWFLSPFGEPIWVRQDGLREDQESLEEPAPPAAA